MTAIELLTLISDEGPKDLQHSVMFVGALELKVSHCRNTMNIRDVRLHRQVLSGLLVELK